MYLLNTNLEETKSLQTALCALYGVGKNRSRALCEKLGVSEGIQLSQLSLPQRERVIHSLQQEGHLGTPLKTEIRHHKARLKLISCYRAIRHSQGLPCRGQHTHGNARTARKKL